MTTNIDLFGFLDYFTWPEQVGVFSSDNIPRSISDSLVFDIIANVAGVEEEGTHFISISRRNSEIRYYDSFYLDIREYPVLYSFVKSCGITTLRQMLSGAVQDINSDLCGFFALHYLLSGNNTINKPENLDFFSTSEHYRTANDVKCMRNIIKFFLDNIKK